MRATKEPQVDAELARSQGLTTEEFEQLVEMLGRSPSWTELGVAAALWSEHCSYKSSKLYLRELPSHGARVLQGPGENAGIVDLGDGWVAVFKMESHNQVSSIEPYQGAATGVGGILRDIFTMGARPIALLDSLRFGAIGTPGMRHLVDGVVRGIGDYGNRVGVPTVGGETSFHPSYDGNIVVNAFALGVARRERVLRARASGAGNPLLYVGSRTGRDGIHGATMAAESFDADREEQLPAVQVGDPFTQKALLEACLQALKSGAVLALQDMGAAGLTRSSFEMAGRGEAGIEIDLDRVPLREPGLTPFEIMLSESQERMVLVARRGREEQLERIFDRWGLEVERIGEVTSNGRAVFKSGGQVMANLPVRPLTEGSPALRRPVEVPSDLQARQEMPVIPGPGSPAAALGDLLDTPELGSKEWIWRQYDHTVRSNTVLGPGGDAAVLVVKGTSMGIALTSDVNPVYCSLDPRRGGTQAVAEAVRNLACVGAEPIGVTDCLNFGNPQDPEVAWQFQESVRGIAHACRVLEVPVISGNVSFYNESDGGSIYPTPTIAMAGVLPDLEQVPKPWFAEVGDRVVLLGEDGCELGGSAYLRLLHGIEQGRPPAVDLEAEARLADLLLLLAFEGSLRTAHDVSEGGLAVTLAEACFGRGLGAKLKVPLDKLALFSETQARAVIAVPPETVDEVLGEAEEAGVPAADVGAVGGSALVIQGGGFRMKAEVEDLHRRWHTALPKALEGVG